MIVEEPATNFVCGRAFGPTFTKYDGRPRVLDRRCKQCFRRFPAETR